MMERLVLLPGTPRPEGVADVIRCSFNPAEVEMTRSANLSPRPAALVLDQSQINLTSSLNRTSQLPFSYGGPAHTTLSLRLLFEAPEDPHSGRMRDVRQLTWPLHALAGQVSAGYTHPCSLDLIWGKQWSFTGTISRLSEVLDDFTSSGIATRSWLAIEIWALGDIQRPFGGSVQIASDSTIGGVLG